ncbi:hypothetical protein [uncultured Paraglaciecola sp.]|uniref:hypothetical protein n=1 Tax=uncultured Paraglaciecola sp. TaxID=1765024 RepID=UPI00262A1CF8|nr:hypothetical protein [uncultured Paraglaciecola sp.]
MKYLMIFLTAILLSACSSTLPPEVLTALTKEQVANPDANTFVMKGDWECKSPSKDCEIRVPLGGNSLDSSTERMRLLVSYYNNQDTALDWFRAFTPFLSQSLSIWDNSRRDKRHNDFLLQQLASQTNEQVALYDMISQMSVSSNSASANIANSGFESLGGLATSNASTFESAFNAQGETTRSIFEFLPDSGDVISNNYSYDFNDSFKQYADSFNPSTETINQALQPINWEGLASFADVLKPAPVIESEDPEPAP